MYTKLLEFYFIIERLCVAKFFLLECTFLWRFFAACFWDCRLIPFDLFIQTGGQFTEDGSFIGQYVPGKLNPPVSPQPIHHQQAGTSGAATYV